MIRSTGGLPESSTTFNKPNCDSDGQRNTANSLNNVVVVTVPSVNLTNPSTSVIVVSQSTTTMSSSSRNSRNNINYKCSCKELASHPSHRSNHYLSGVHSSHFQHHGNHHHHHHHYNHPGHKENYTSRSVVESSNSSSASGIGSGTSSSHHYSSHYSTSHQTASTFQQNIRHNSFPIKWKPAISRHLQEFMISLLLLFPLILFLEWEQFHAHLLHSNNIVTKSCCTGATTINNGTLTTVAINNQFTTSGDSTNNHDSPSSSNDMTSSRTSLSDNSSSGQIANSQSNNNGSNNNSGNNSPSIIESNIIGRSSGSRVNDLPVTLATITTTTTISDTTQGPGSNNASSNTCGVAISNCSSYPRRKQSCGYVTNQMGKVMNTGSLGWKRNQTSGRKNSSPGNFNNRYPVSYFSNRNSPFIISTTTTTSTTATSNSLLPVVTYISSSITTITTTTTTTTTTPTVVNLSNTDQMTITTVTVNNQPNSQSSSVIDFKTNPSVPTLSSSSLESCIQQKVSSLPESNSIFKVDIYNTLTVTNSIINSQKLEIKTENIDKVSDMKIHVNNNCVVIAQQHLSDLHLTSGDDNNNTVVKLKEDIPVDESTKNSCVTLSNSSFLLLPEEEKTSTTALISKVDQEIGSSISCGKVEEGECYWTPDPPASPENNTIPHENYSSTYHSTSISPSPPQLSVSLPCSKDLNTTAYHPPLGIRTELSSMLDFRRCSQPRDFPLISSSNNSRLESLNDVD
ncbi:hypothetical protein MS3_00008540 [Schistosoma haematobium]|uniref:Uncharacterized protein n=1 Tax=Schistosoma haematobium TaxID=6185 RepID=A0A922LFD0_SCHHA|nr:hypothetical protein MS3_00008540 [Schistosoma haematobium]KAH9581381.1 hypothetical protein MS3_00008540 [Schistosoma haematobium]